MRADAGQMDAPTSPRLRASLPADEPARRRQSCGVGRSGSTAETMAARWTQLLAAVVTVSVAMATPDEVEELPKPAAHKQIIYRYIPIDKSFLGLDKAYDDFYKTGTSDETYAPLRNRDEYDRNSYYYNDDYDRYSSSHRRRDDYYRDSDRRRNEVDTYTTYSRDDHDHGHRRNDDYYNYDYDYSQDYSSGESSSSGRRPSRRRQRRPQRKDTGSSAAKTALDFVEAVGRRSVQRGPLL